MEATSTEHDHTESGQSPHDHRAVVERYLTLAKSLNVYRLLFSTHDPAPFSLAAYVSVIPLIPFCSSSLHLTASLYLG